MTDGADVCGVGVFAATLEKATAPMEGDPGWARGFSYQVHACLGFPGGRAHLSAG